MIDPDLVIVGFFLGNDVGDDYFYTYQAHVSKVDRSVFFEDHKMPWSYLFEVLDGSSNTSTLMNRVKVPNEIEADHHLSVLRHYVKAGLLKSHLVRILKKLRDQMHLQREYRERHEREAQLILD